MRKKYTHIFFDLDNTLWDFEKNSESAMQVTFNHFNLDKFSVEFNDFFKTYSKNNHDLWAKYRKKEVGKKELIKRRFLDTFSELGIKGVEPEKMNDFYLKEMPKQNRLFDGVLETLKYLKSKRYKMYIITNGFREVQHSKLESAGLKPFFDKVFTSEEIKCPKPNREIFEHAVKSVNAKKVKSIMIGDDWEVDILGATNFGIDAVHYASSKKSGAREIGQLEVGNNSVCHIDSLREISNLL